MKSAAKASIFTLLFSLILFGGIAIYLGKDLGWDLAAYHYYNPYAWFHHRYNIDVWPASTIQTFLNPTLDFLTYFLIKHFSPWQAVFIMGALHGMNAWLAFMIARLFFPDSKTNCLKAILLALVGCYGPITLSEIGSFQGDLTISSFVLGAVFLQLLSFKQKPKTFIFFSGLLLGIAAGLKLTACLYVVGMSLALIFYKPRLLFLWLWGVGIGFLICNGYWMYHLWQIYHNPFFPFFNHLFQSNDFTLSNWRDERFLPKNSWQALFYPFYFSWNGQTTDLPFMDFRFAIIWLLLCVFLINLIIKKIKITNLLRWLIIFFVSSYIIWEIYFSNMRYLVSLEILAPLFIYLLLEKIMKDNLLRMGLTVAVMVFLIVSMRPMLIAERFPTFGDHYFNVVIPSAILQEKNVIVLVPYSEKVQHPIPYPQTYLIPFFPKPWRFVGIPINVNHYYLPEKVNNVVKAASGHFYLLTTQQTLPILYEAASALGLKKTIDHCQVIISDRQRLRFLQQDPLLLCPVEKIITQ